MNDLRIFIDVPSHHQLGKAYQSKMRQSASAHEECGAVSHLANSLFHVTPKTVNMRAHLRTAKRDGW